MSAKRSKRGDSKNKGNGESEPLPAGKYGELFQGYKQELVASQDKHEQLVKLSRDCTIQSKRAIFALHRFSGEEATKGQILAEADSKFKEDILPILHSICEEIGAGDPYRHHRAYSPGLQEFIEALAFYRYLKSGRLISYEEAQSFLTFPPKSSSKAETGAEEEEVEKSDPSKETAGGPSNEESLSSSPKTQERSLALYLPPSDYLLGLADLTGELMRLCINAVGSGNRELPFALLPFFRALFCGFHSFSSGVKLMNQKMHVLRSSLGKVESVCYTLKVRGSEIPKQMLMDVINAAPHETEPIAN